MIDKIVNLPDSASLIPLTCRTYAIVDTGNLRNLNLYRWSLGGYKKGTRYARRSEKGQTIYMHREIMNAPEGMEIDHINGNGLDNRSANLRICTKAQNQQNSKKRTGKSSVFKGISWETDRKKWRASIVVNKKRICIGRFISEIDAAKAYDVEALSYFGEYARTNFKESNIEPSNAGYQNPPMAGTIT